MPSSTSTASCYGDTRLKLGREFLHDEETGGADEGIEPADRGCRRHRAACRDPSACGVRGQPTWSRHDGRWPMDNARPLSQGSQIQRHTRVQCQGPMPRPCAPCSLQCNTRTPRRVVDCPPSAHLPRDATTHSSNAVAWPARWPPTALPHARRGLIGGPRRQDCRAGTGLRWAGRELDSRSCGQASALSTRPPAQSCADQPTDLPALLYAAHHVVPLDTALGAA